jgi:superfamily II DNA/RNA helicase
MTPLRKFISRIAARRPADLPPEKAAPAREPTRPPTQQQGARVQKPQQTGRGPEHKAEPARNGRRRPQAKESNGRAAQPTVQTTTESTSEPRNYAWGRSVGGDDSAKQDRDDRRTATLRRRRGFRPSRDRLEQPLPEDVAFRSRDEGGDTTILPARRRKPKGLRTTERIIYAGDRFMGFAWKPLFSKNGTPQTETPLSALDDVEAADDAGEIDVADEVRIEVEDADRLAVRELVAKPEPPATAPKRRRGSRGGRGRRARAEAETGAEDLDEAGEEPTEVTAERAPAARTPSAAVLDVPPERYPEAFRALGLGDRTLAVMAAFGFEHPTPIQDGTIPLLLEGKDVVGLAQTGSGKTVAFGAPMVERLDPERREVQGLVMVPTRELAQQVLDVLAALGRPCGLDAIGLLGGRALRRDFAALEARPHIVVGTPGRVIDHLRRGTLSLRRVSYAVLDEADEMLDIGFLPDIRRILAHTPKERQTALFSATMPTTVKRLVWQFMRDPETVAVDAELSTVESVQQIYFEVASQDKVPGLRELIDRELKGRTLVFCKMKRSVDRLARQLSGMGVRVGALHGDLDQRARDQVVEAFRKGQLDILIATNVAARGLDIPEITHVVNFDAPQTVEEYVHRIGRTGRAGREGKAITFISEHELAEHDLLLEQFGHLLHRERLDLYA